MTGFFENVYEYTYNDIKLKRMKKKTFPRQAEGFLLIQAQIRNQLPQIFYYTDFKKKPSILTSGS